MKNYLPLFTLLLLIGCTGEEELMHIREKVSTVNITIDNEGEKPPILYTANISANTVFCGGMVNGLEQLDNLGTESGTFASGFNATAFLQPGENTLDLWMFPLGLYKEEFDYKEDDRCEVALYGAFADGQKLVLSSLTATIEEGKPTIETSAIYPSKHRSPLAETREMLDGYLTEFARPIYIKTIPRWRWVDATPIREDNPDQMRELYRAYTYLLTLMERRDFEGLKMAWSLSNREKAMAEAYYSSPDEFFDVVGFESMFQEASDAKVEPRREWYDYELKSFMGGRLVRLEDERSHSPLRIASYDKGWIYSVTPYFSMIDGRIVVSR